MRCDEGVIAGRIEVALHLPYVWVAWSVPRGLFYRHDEDEGEDGAPVAGTVEQAQPTEEQR